MSFFTRPNFEDRQQVQYSGSTITLSGETNINQTGQIVILGTILDFTGSTTASTSVTLVGTTGYVNNGNISGLKIQPPIVFLSGSTGSTSVDVTNYVLSSFDSNGTVVWKQPVGVSSGDCISDLYVSNIHGCSPITVWDQLQHIGSSATTQFSTSFGYNNRSYGENSNSHGQESIAGAKGFVVSGNTIVNGLVTLDSSYGDITSELNIYYRLVLSADNNPFSLQNIGTFTYNTSLSATTIQLEDNTLTVYCTHVINVDNINNSTGDVVFGLNSHAEGYSNISIGDSSHTEGGLDGEVGGTNLSIGHASHSEGVGNISTGIASHVEGRGNISNGNYSHAEGNETITFGNYSHSEGHLTTANGSYSHTEGIQTVAYGQYSHTEGNQTKTYAPYSHAEGQLNISGLVYLYSDYVSGSTTGYLYIDTNHGDVTEYFQNGDYLFISDVNSNKNFLISTYHYTVDGASYQEISPSISGTVISLSPDPGFIDDLGSNLLIANLTNPLPIPPTINDADIFDASHTEGSNNISFGLNSHAEGYLTLSYGEASHSQGRSTKSIGDYSFASGLNTYADGNQTFIHSTNSHIKSSNFTSILGGNSNTIEDSSTNSGIFSGRDSTINSSLHSSIIGGSENTLINSFNSVIIGGDSNIINNLTNTVILGSSNKIASNSDTVYVPDLVITPITVPTTSGDTVGEVGSISWDDTYFYIKTNTGWGRISLDYGF